MPGGISDLTRNVLFFADGDGEPVAFYLLFPKR